MKKNFCIYKNMLSGKVFAATNKKMGSLDSNYRLLYTAEDLSTWYEKHEFLIPIKEEDRENTFEDLFKKRGVLAWEEDICGDELGMGDECELNCELAPVSFDCMPENDHIWGEAVVEVRITIDTDAFAYSEDADVVFDYEAIRFSNK